MTVAASVLTDRQVPVSAGRLAGEGLKLRPSLGEELTFPAGFSSPLKRGERRKNGDLQSCFCAWDPKLISGKSLSRQTSEKEAGSGSSCHPTPFILARGSLSILGDVVFPKSSKPLRSHHGRWAKCSLHQSDPCGGRKPGEKRALAGSPSWPWPSAPGWSPSKPQGASRSLAARLRRSLLQNAQIWIFVTVPLPCFSDFWFPEFLATAWTCFLTCNK